MKVLNLFAGLGGNRKLWNEVADIKVTAVEFDKDIAKAYAFRYPNDEVIVADAYEYAAKHYDKFDFIWASPPCQTHSRLNFGNVRWENSRKLPDFNLYSLITYLQKRCFSKYVVENVIPYYTPLLPPSVSIGRHYFWSNFEIKKVKFKTKKQLARIVLSDFTDFDIAAFSGIKNKRQAIRNEVDYELGRYIFECAVKG
ncbi:DNA cytosine methyltransferase [Campylobacter sp. RM12920]|uniref:DNA cytosine methyltransferase n=1 Tax=Campylobacter californiensis TaxID=1032243 RepID=A0ABD4JFH0_9BACT|nr:DNA cytosine methyltransferase [Campylobacter sp. RM12919]MBE2987438.1 DNA cytosine methyltransferase [Campylobacter sp. RM12920]